MYKWFDSNVLWMNIFTSIFSWFHIILNVNFFFKTELSNFIFSKKKMIIFQENAKMLKSDA